MKKGILIVEDNPDVREAIRQLLSTGPYDVRAVRDGSEALALLATSTDVSLVVLDLMMPALSGWELLAELRAHPYMARIPVIVVSALAEPPSGIDAEAYLQKPFRAEALMRMVNSLVRDPPRA